jgi:hypothetical protein
MNDCKTCKHWDRERGEFHGADDGRGYCKRLAEPKYEDSPPLVAWPACGHDGPAVEFETAPDFGCALWTAKGASTFSVEFKAKEARSAHDCRAIVTRAGAVFWPVREVGGWVIATAVPWTEDGPPRELLTFESREEAEGFGLAWKGHPWYYRPASFKVIEVRPRFTKGLIGWEITDG